MNEATQVVKKIIKKSELQAETIYDYKRLEYHNDRFLNCVIEEQDENVEITYKVRNYHSMESVRTCAKQERLRILLDTSCLYEMWNEYSFEINPRNLFFDENYRVYVMDRDVFPKGEVQHRDFLREYKALIGYTLQKKYRYEDYIEGGMDLLRKNSFLGKVLQKKTLSEVKELLEEEYYRIVEENRLKKRSINKNVYRRSLVYIIFSAILLLAGMVMIVNYTLIEKPRLEAKLEAEINFLKGDYIQVIDDLSGIAMEHLSYDQKYILSVAYVNLESLTVEQKNNILEDIPINGDEKLMEYWIYIGRLNPVEAQNIAMQKSDDELLLYAYMLEKDLTETNTVMTGEEKAAKLDELEGKIQKLAEQYIVEEE